MIQEIIYKNYINTKKKTKYDVLKSYLSNLSEIKDVNRYKLNQAVKNINNELEEAEKEFRELFKEEKELN